MSSFGITQPIFNVDLETVMSYQKEKYPDVSIPIVFILMRDTILALKGETAEGLFRIPGKQEEIDGYKEYFNQGKYEIFKECNCHTIAGLFKLFLRELPNSVIPLENYDNFVNEKTVEDIETDSSNIQPLLELLPPVNRAMTIFIINFLQLIAQHAEETKMGVDNLAMVFSACMLISTNMDPYSALTKTNIAKSCIAALIRHLPDDAIKQVNILIENYEPLSGMTQTEIDPIIQYVEMKEFEQQMQNQIKSKDKDHAKGFGIFRARSQSQSKNGKRLSSQNYDVPPSSNSPKEDSISSSFQSLSSPTSSPLVPPKRITSVCLTDTSVMKSIEKEKTKDQQNKLWDLDLAPSALNRPTFLVSKPITV